MYNYQNTTFLNSVELATLVVGKASVIELKILQLCGTVPQTFKNKQILMRNGIITGAFLENLEFLSQAKEGMEKDKKQRPIEAKKKE